MNYLIEHSAGRRLLSTRFFYLLVITAIYSNFINNINYAIYANLQLIYPSLTDQQLNTINYIPCWTYLIIAPIIFYLWSHLSLNVITYVTVGITLIGSILYYFILDHVFFLYTSTILINLSQPVTMSAIAPLLLAYFDQTKINSYLTYVFLLVNQLPIISFMIIDYNANFQSYLVDTLFIIYLLSIYYLSTTNYLYPTIIYLELKEQDRQEPIMIKRKNIWVFILYMIPYLYLNLMGTIIYNIFTLYRGDDLYFLLLILLPIPVTTVMAYYADYIYGVKLIISVTALQIASQIWMSYSLSYLPIFIFALTFSLVGFTYLTTLISYKEWSPIFINNSLLFINALSCSLANVGQTSYHIYDYYHLSLIGIVPFLILIVIVLYRRS